MGRVLNLVLALLQFQYIMRLGSYLNSSVEGLVTRRDVCCHGGYIGLLRERAQAENQHYGERVANHWGQM